MAVTFNDYSTIMGEDLARTVEAAPTPGFFANQTEYCRKLQIDLRILQEMLGQPGIEDLVDSWPAEDIKLKKAYAALKNLPSLRITGYLTSEDHIFMQLSSLLAPKLNTEKIYESEFLTWTHSVGPIPYYGGVSAAKNGADQSVKIFTNRMGTEAARTNLGKIIEFHTAEDSPYTKIADDPKNRILGLAVLLQENNYTLARIPERKTSKDPPPADSPVDLNNDYEWKKGLAIQKFRKDIQDLLNDHRDLTHLDPLPETGEDSPELRKGMEKLLEAESHGEIQLHPSQKLIWAAYTRLTPTDVAKLDEKVAEATRYFINDYARTKLKQDADEKVKFPGVTVVDLKPGKNPDAVLKEHDQLKKLKEFLLDTQSNPDTIRRTFKSALYGNVESALESMNIKDSRNKAGVDFAIDARYHMLEAFEFSKAVVNKPAPPPMPTDPEALKIYKLQDLIKRNTADLLMTAGTRNFYDGYVFDVEKNGEIGQPLLSYDFYHTIAPLPAICDLNFGDVNFLRHIQAKTDMSPNDILHLKAGHADEGMIKLVRAMASYPDLEKLDGINSAQIQAIRLIGNSLSNEQITQIRDAPLNNLHSAIDRMPSGYLIPPGSGAPDDMESLGLRYFQGMKNIHEEIRSNHKSIAQIINQIGTLPKEMAVEKQWVVNLAEELKAQALKEFDINHPEGIEKDETLQKQRKAIESKPRQSYLAEYLKNFPPKNNDQNTTMLSGRTDDVTAMLCRIIYAAKDNKVGTEPIFKNSAGLVQTAGVLDEMNRNIAALNPYQAQELGKYFMKAKADASYHIVRDFNQYIIDHGPEINAYLPPDIKLPDSTEATGNFHNTVFLERLAAINFLQPPADDPGKEKFQKLTKELSPIMAELVPIMPFIQPYMLVHQMGGNLNILKDDLHALEMTPLLALKASLADLQGNPLIPIAPFDPSKNILDMDDDFVRSYASFIESVIPLIQEIDPKITTAAGLSESEILALVDERLAANTEEQPAETSGLKTQIAYNIVALAKDLLPGFTPPALSGVALYDDLRKKSGTFSSPEENKLYNQLLANIHLQAGAQSGFVTREELMRAGLASAQTEITNPDEAQKFLSGLALGVQSPDFTKKLESQSLTAEEKQSIPVIQHILAQVSETMNLIVLNPDINQDILMAAEKLSASHPLASSPTPAAGDNRLSANFSDHAGIKISGLDGFGNIVPPSTSVASRLPEYHDNRGNLIDRNISGSLDTGGGLQNKPRQPGALA